MRALKYLSHLFTALILFVSMPILFMGGRELGRYLGLIPTSVPVAGTGSMYPSLYWDAKEEGPDDLSKQTLDKQRLEPAMYRYFAGIKLFNHTFLRPILARGDMIAFKNHQTEQILKNEGKDPSAGFIKRILALPKDTVELRDGFLFINNER